MSRYDSRALFPQPAHHAEDAGLGPHVQGAGGLVEHQHPGLHAERAGDRDPLALAAGQLMRVPGRKAGVEPGLGQQGGHPLRDLPPRDDPVGQERLTDGGADAHPRVEAVVRVLEHDLHGPPVVTQRPAALIRHVFALEPDLARGDGGQAQHRSPDGRLAGSALPDQAESERAGVDVQAHPVYRAHQTELHPRSLTARIGSGR